MQLANSTGFSSFHPFFLRGHTQSCETLTKIAHATWTATETILAPVSKSELKASQIETQVKMYLLYVQHDTLVSAQIMNS